MTMPKWALLLCTGCNAPLTRVRHPSKTLTGKKYSTAVMSSYSLVLKVHLSSIQSIFRYSDKQQRCSIRTTVTPSLSSDSPNTRMKRTSLTWTCSNTARTATGSTAAIRLPNRRYCSRPMSASPETHRAEHRASSDFCFLALDAEPEKDVKAVN